ncbi:MAG TPA: ABC transporter ATP-binding protein [Pirellulales bacterium]|jgi:ABC-2 type transport system ATP-binding protein|nr:ABC transporter ATP-binding protein [Pirellulales bacterium]
MPLVEVHHLSRRYGSVQALCDVTLSLAAGTIGLVGNNGAGKSTLLKILLGLLAPSEGRGTILGCDVSRAGRLLRGRIGYMSESAGVVPVLTGAEYVALAGDLQGMPHRDARRRSHEVLGYVALGELRYRRLEEYSAGNVQRLKLAAALVHDPELLLLDEPTNGLDPAGRNAMLDLLDDLIAETKKSVILCTHLLGDVERLCRQIVVLHRGSVVRAGTIDQLRADASNRYELGWHGAGERFLAILGASGAVLSDVSTQTAMVTVPADWSPTEFFRLAAAEGVVVNHLKPDEEDLERLFFRVTDGGGERGAGNPEHGAEERRGDEIRR